MRSDNAVRFQVYSPILKVLTEEKSIDLYEELLRLNATILSCCSFGIEDDNSIVIGTDRTTQNLSLVEIDELVANVSSNAIQYSNELSEKFANQLQPLENGNRE